MNFPKIAEKDAGHLPLQVQGGGQCHRLQRQDPVGHRQGQGGGGPVEFQAGQAGDISANNEGVMQEGYTIQILLSALVPKLYTRT